MAATALPSAALDLGLLSAALTFFACQLRAVLALSRDAPAPTGAYPLVYQIRTPDGERFPYRFAVEPHGNGYRVLIGETPSYGSRPADFHTTHRLLLGGKQYVCWNSPIRTHGEAEAVAALWAQKTTAYIRYGQRF